MFGLPLDEVLSLESAVVFGRVVSACRLQLCFEVIVRSIQRNWVRECWRSFGCERPGMNTANPHQSWTSSLIVLESKMASSRLLHVSFHEKYSSMASQHPGFFGFVFKCSAPFIVSMKMFESKCSMKKYAIGTPNRATVGE